MAHGLSSITRLWLYTSTLNHTYAMSFVLILCCLHIIQFLIILFPLAILRDYPLSLGWFGIKVSNCHVFCCRVDRNKYQIQIPLPPKIDPSVTMMTVEEKPDVTYNDVGGCKEQIEKMREVCKSFFISLLLLINLLSNSSFSF